MEVFSITQSNKETKLTELFVTMFRIGLFTFGGGYAMLSIITDEFVDRKNWITHDEMLDMIAISESLPGAIAINTSIAVGYKIRGLFGAIAAVAGVICPSIGIITVVTYLYEGLPVNSPIWLFIKGVRAGVIGLMMSVILRLGKKSIKNSFSALMFICGFLLAYMTNIPVFFIIVAGGVAGYMYGKAVDKNAA